MSKFEQALREWAENYDLAAMKEGGGVDPVRAIAFLAHKITDDTTDDPEPAPWTFGDLEVGDWFEDAPGVVYQRTGDDAEPINATGEDGKTHAWFAPDDVVHPFEWEWV